jgi:hypothetical protein
MSAMYKSGKALNYNPYQVVQSVFLFCWYWSLFSTDQHIEVILWRYKLDVAIVMILNNRNGLISSAWISGLRSES